MLAAKAVDIGLMRLEGCVGLGGRRPLVRKPSGRATSQVIRKFRPEPVIDGGCDAAHIGNRDYRGPAPRLAQCSSVTGDKVPG